MSEEIPPSSLVTPPRGRGAEPGADVRYTLRLTTRRWAAIPAAAPTKAAATVLGAWLVLAWNRFGFQGVDQPRVMARFVLVGVYGWLGFVAVIWLADRLLGSGAAANRDRPGSRGIDPPRLLQLIGLSHLALVVLAVVIQIGQAVPIPLIVPAFTVFVLLLWFPGMLLAAVLQAWSTSEEASGPVPAAVTGVAYVFWFLTVGRYLLDQLGHLI